MTRRRGLLKGRGPLPREKAVIGAGGDAFPSTESFFSVQRMVVTSEDPGRTLAGEDESNA
jgi:hypothetical protein